MGDGHGFSTKEQIDAALGGFGDGGGAVFGGGE
jgi:hypothetical protein